MDQKPFPLPKAMAEAGHIKVVALTKPVTYRHYLLIEDRPIGLAPVAEYCTLSRVHRNHFVLMSFVTLFIRGCHPLHKKWELRRCVFCFGGCFAHSSCIDGPTTLTCDHGHPVHRDLIYGSNSIEI